jgi:hypothetical protein
VSQFRKHFPWVNRRNRSRTGNSRKGNGKLPVSRIGAPHFSWLFEDMRVEPTPLFELGYGFQLEASYKVTKSLVGMKGTQHSNQKKSSAA